ncbi:trigger factor [Thioclava sp. BHET1]|nr:trigger factor [Thioclava sp. BHET1]
MRQLADFGGEWRIARRIEDRRAGQSGAFEGRAVSTPDAAGLVYAEEGVLRIGSGPGMRAERRYFWQAAGAEIAVFFADGRAFHQFDPAEGGPAARHYCDPDIYDVVYDFSRWPDWRAIWEVRGPRKDYRMESLYQR